MQKKKDVNFRVATAHGPLHWYTTYMQHLSHTLHSPYLSLNFR